MKSLFIKWMFMFGNMAVSGNLASINTVRLVRQAHCFTRQITHSRTQSPSYARCDEGLWPNP